MNKKLIISILVIASGLIASCSGDPLLTELCTNRIKLVVKGTFESTNPAPWDLSGDIKCESWVETITDATLTVPTVFYFDVSEVRLDGDKFARYRTILKEPLSSSSNLFNGVGVSFQNDDIYPDEKYTEMQFYIRKMGFNAGYICNDSWAVTDETTFFFDKDDVSGFDFNLKQVRQYNYTDDDDTNLVFPLTIPVGGEIVFDGEGEWVLETRLVIVNNIARYTNTNETIDSKTKKVSYWALDDNICSVDTDNADTSITTDDYIGGNIASVCYAYKIGYTGTISRSLGTTQLLCAVPAGDDITEYISGKIPPIVVRGNGGTTYLENVPVGTAYDIYTANLNIASLLNSTSGDYTLISSDVVIANPGDNVAL